MQRKVDFIRQPVISSSVVGPGSSKAPSKANLAPKRVMVTIWWSAAHLIDYSFLTLSAEKYAQQIDEMHPNCNAHSWHWSTERAQFFSMTMPDHISHNQRFKSWMNLAKVLPRLQYLLTSWTFTDLSPNATSSIISTTFCKENVPITRRTQKMLSKNLSNPEAQIFTLQE